MEDWKESLHACFGMSDRRFAGHPQDQDRAREMLARAGAKGVTWRELEREARGYLTSLGAAPSHIDEQIALMARTDSFLRE
jgi:hypothetical protein